jgi:hypothetical protein
MQRNNLPAQLTSFVGRKKALAELTRLLPSVRLLTLTGAGGIGKTRLALQVAEAMERPDGVWLVELASLEDPGLVAPQIARSLGVRERSGQSALETLIDHLRASHALLVIDNCEHLLSGCAEVLEALARSCPALTVLATSRQSLGIAVTTEAIAPQRAADLEYVATFPAFYITSTAHDVRGVADLHSSRARLPENNFRVPGLGNQSRYRSAELDVLVDRYQSTIPEGERARAMGDINLHVAEHLNLMGLTYGGSPELIANRVLNIASNRAITNPWNTWNSHEWDLRP